MVEHTPEILASEDKATTTTTMIPTTIRPSHKNGSGKGRVVTCVICIGLLLLTPLWLTGLKAPTN